MASGIVAIVPAHNEEKYIENVITSLQKCVKQKVIDDFLIIENGSTDKTRQIAIKKGAKGKIISTKYPSKGYAFLLGARWAKKKNKKIIVTIDADLEKFEPIAIKALVKPVIKKEAQMAIALTKEPKSNGRFCLDPEYSGQRAININSIKNLLKPGIRFENLMKRKGFSLEVALNHLIPKNISVGDLMFFDHGLTYFNAKRPAMHEKKELIKLQTKAIIAIHRYFRRFDTQIKKGALLEKPKRKIKINVKNRRI